MPPWSSPAASPQEEAAGDAAPRAASGCISFCTAVTVAGLDLDGRSFLSNSYTEMVAASGCSIVLKQALAIDDELDVRIGNREVQGRVAGKIRSLAAGHVYAIEFDDSAPVAWNVTFPESSGPESVVPLRCSACDLAGDVTLTGVAVLVFEGNANITRTCPRCCERTRWGREKGAHRQVQHKGPLPSSQPHLENSAEALPLASSIQRLKPQPQSRAGDQRRNSRVHLKGAKACVQRNGSSDEVVIVDISRGGLRFVSYNRYELGDWLRVAAPYVPGGNNIFVGAEIVRVQGRAGGQTPGEYALIFRSR